MANIANWTDVTEPTIMWPGNDSLHVNDAVNKSWAHFFMPCANWEEPQFQHVLFQLAHGCFFISCLSPDTSIGILVMHGFFGLGGLLHCAWTWNVICAPDIFSWTFGLAFLSLIQVLYDLYRLRPVRFDPEVETVFSQLFEPLGISRVTFKKLVSPEYAEICSLHAGEAYALQNLTRTDRLSLLISGRAQVVADRTTLHTIDANEFLDSPEFESSRASLEDKFRVSIVASAASPCRYICWQRSSLEYLFVKETTLANVFCVLVSRDVINKVYAMNKKLAVQKGIILDIRLPGIASCPYGPFPESSPSNTSSDMSEESSPLKSTPNGTKGNGAFSPLISH